MAEPSAFAVLAQRLAESMNAQTAKTMQAIQTNPEAHQYDQTSLADVLRPPFPVAFEAMKPLSRGAADTFNAGWAQLPAEYQALFREFYPRGRPIVSVPLHGSAYRDVFSPGVRYGFDTGLVLGAEVDAGSYNRTIPRQEAASFVAATNPQAAQHELLHALAGGALRNILSPTTMPWRTLEEEWASQVESGRPHSTGPQDPVLTKRATTLDRYLRNYATDSWLMRNLRPRPF